jgi:apolipoprotein N-acyltransferase
MHLQASLFRSVETKRSLVRAANTGISCGIDPYGRVLKYVQNDRRKKTYVEGAAVLWVPLNTGITFYTKNGDVFTYLCFLCILWAGYTRKNNSAERLLKNKEKKL